MCIQNQNQIIAHWVWLFTEIQLKKKKFSKITRIELMWDIKQQQTSLNVFKLHCEHLKLMLLFTFQAIKYVINLKNNTQNWTFFIYIINTMESHCYIKKFLINPDAVNI